MLADVLPSPRCACASGFLSRLCGTVQWTVFAAATAAMFTVSLVGHSRPAVRISGSRLAVIKVFSFHHQVPFTYVDYDSNARLWPAVHQAHEMVDRYQLVNSYGLFRRMTGVGGRPEVVIEGSHDGVTWTVSVAAHQVFNPVIWHQIFASLVSLCVCVCVYFFAGD